jgi:hypothetical protein
MTLADFGASLVRTYVPIIVGMVLGWLTAHGLGISGSDAISVTAGLTGAIAAAYWLGIRLLEAKWPALGIFLGRAAAPTYGPPAAAAPGAPDRAGGRHAGP